MSLSRPGLSAALLLASAVVVAQPAFADDVAVNLNPLGLKGQSKPAVEVTVEKPLRSLELTLTRTDGQRVHFKVTGVTAGTVRTFYIDQPEGTFHYDGKLVATFVKGEPRELPLTFDASVYGALKVTVDLPKVDLKEHSVTLTADRAIATLHVEVLADDGHALAEYDDGFPNMKPNEAVTTVWHPDDEAAVVLRIVLRATDAYGIFQEIDLYPWKFEIPHEDVLFDTGKSDIVESERPKVETAYGKLTEAVAKYGKWAKVQLFVGGYTDTVGDSGSNKTLSEARARSIARYFRSRGIKIPIYFAGFGEDGLLVPTADETPEPKNRRATYLVAVETPGGVHWSKLP